jgi:hypothetical protein
MERVIAYIDGLNLYHSIKDQEEQERVNMPKPERSGKQWTKQEVQKLEDLAKHNTPTRVIAIKIKRTPEAVASKASDENISLKPTNQSPYNRRKK